MRKFDKNPKQRKIDKQVLKKQRNKNPPDPSSADATLLRATRRRARGLWSPFHLFI